VDDTTNEITQFQPLLERLDLAGRVVTADALHTQHTHADWLVSVKHAAYLLIVKANQPTLHQQLVFRDGLVEGRQRLPGRPLLDASSGSVRHLADGLGG
jgi:hypothetical protein